LDHGGGTYERRPVKIGRRGEEFVEILEGVSEGDRVVTSGNLLIDSQAQLSHGVGEESASHQHHTEASGPAPNPPKSSPAPILMTPEQTGAAREFLGRVVFPLSEQLANDNLAGYNELIPHAKTSMSALAAAFGNETLRGSLSRIQTEMAKLKTQSDLAAARASYKDFSAAAVDFYRAISPAIGAAAKIYKCPMYPKPGQTGYWLQDAGPLRNQYFGSEMIDCGTEEK
jgi:Cu(I)/Ag(I) efflux system membrane fusion protein